MSPARRLYRALQQVYGPQRWWPADSRFEMMVGAVLTQNTAWTNAELAIKNLQSSQLLNAQAIIACPLVELAQQIRPSGYFNVKSRRLRELACWFNQHGEFDALDTWQTVALRSSLLAVKGIGEETADAILLYAFARPLFVIDTYTRRLLGRLGLASGEETYTELQAWFHAGLGLEPAVFNEFHALIVEHAKQLCRKRPRCAECMFVRSCPGLHVAPLRQ